MHYSQMSAYLLGIRILTQEPSPQERYSRFQLMRMIKGFFGVSNFRFWVSVRQENLASTFLGGLI